MKKKVIPMLLLACLVLPQPIQVFAQETTTDDILKTQVNDSSIIDTDSSEDASINTDDFGKNDSTDNTQSSSIENSTEQQIEKNTQELETKESDAAESENNSKIPTSLEYYGEDENGTYSIPRNRSDLKSSPQLRATLPHVTSDLRNTPTKSFIDVSSHNGAISVNEYKIMKSYGVQGVVVKLTEATTYQNPEAKTQIENAKAAGLKVSAYHYSWFKNDSQAIAEAEYFVAAAKKMGLDSSTVLVNDMEEPQIAGLSNHTQNSLAFETRLKQLGYNNVRHYVGLYWLNNGLINANKLGEKNIWVAAYPYNLSQNNYYTQYGAWQWSAQMSFPGVSGTFDISGDYTNTYSSNEFLIKYSSHVQYDGWQTFASNNQLSGTTGEGKRLEALTISLVNSGVGGIEYQTHVQDMGWENGWKSNGQISGTTGQRKRVEAVKIRLTGSLADRYDIYYRAHSQRFGWLNWAKNGEAAGTEGFAYQLESLQIQLVPKNGTKPSGAGSSFVKFQNYDVVYQSHVQYQGWGPSVKNGDLTGTIGKGLRLEAIKLNLPSNPLNLFGNIEYQTHIQYIGWQGWRSNNSISGTEGQGLRTEAIRIRLTGSLAAHYDVYYRSHSQIYGWLGWTKNGESSGTEGLGKRLEGVEIRIVRKGSNAPGSTSNSFISK